MMKKIIKITIVLGIALFIIVGCSYKQGIKKPVSSNEAKETFVVSAGDGVKKISNNLKAKGLIASKLFFETYVGKEKLVTGLQAGVYELSPSMSIVEIVDILASGETVKNERKIRVIEGWNNRDIANYLESEGICSADDFLATVKKKSEYAEIFDFLKEIPEPYDMEGYLFPDTYSIFVDASVDDIVRKMLANFDKKVTTEMRAEIEKQGKSLYEVVTMAALIEKEVRSREDMKMVSGIFANRLEYGQPLQSCATLAYVLGVNKPRYTLEDTQIDSPYNTYQNKGLPPGPISNPGIQAIEAAIYPTDSDYVFFLTATETGETIFSKTLDEHNLNKAKYLK